MSAPFRNKRLLILSQTFVPDPASVGQHMADVAVEMARRGYAVRVYCSARGYDDPGVHYPRRENLHGVDVRRIPFASFGKQSILTRAAGTFAFMVQVILRGLFAPADAIFFSTSPPLIGVVACMIGLIRGIPVAYWAMDLNPDQLIAMGKISATGFTARFLEAANRWILRRSALVVALDRFMAERLRSRVENLDAKLLVMPPWPHDDELETVAKADNPFIVRHELSGKFVIMYSGNHSPANPLETLLESIAAFKNDPSIRFLFIGGGVGKKAVEEFVSRHDLANVHCLPYQPLADLKYSLTAADVHVVSLGAEMVGIVHPCKIYGAMSAGKPILFLGPRPSHVSDLLEKHSIGWAVTHGDVEAMKRTISQIRATDPAVLYTMGQTAQQILRRELSQEILRGRFCDRMEGALGFKVG